MAVYTMHDGSRVTVSQQSQSVAARSPGESVTVTQGTGSGGVPYTGEYEVTPMAHTGQTLSTNGRVMRADVTVFEIPYAATTNEAGGYTVSIAS